MLLNLILAASIWVAPYAFNDGSVDTFVVVHNMENIQGQVDFHWTEFNCDPCQFVSMLAIVAPNKSIKVKMLESMKEAHLEIFSQVDLAVDGWIIGKCSWTQINFTKKE